MSVFSNPRFIQVDYIYDVRFLFCSHIKLTLLINFMKTHAMASG